MLQRLKHDLTLRHIPVFVVSTVDHPEQGLKLGAQGVLPKPIQTAEVLGEFLEGVRAFVERRERQSSWLKATSFDAINSRIC